MGRKIVRVGRNWSRSDFANIFNMRNPFRKQDENARPYINGVEKRPNGYPVKPIIVKEGKEPVEYQLSGEYYAIDIHSEGGGSVS